MANIELNYEQRIRGAIIFLNTFGLILEEQDSLDSKSVLKVINKQNEEVGYVSFENNDIKINVMSAFGEISASYELSQAEGFVDLETRNGNEKFAKWLSKINYIIQANKKNSIVGNFIIESSMDTFFGVNVTCHQCLEFYKGKKKFMSLKFMSDFKLFEAIFYDKSLEEKIEFAPWEVIFGQHDIRSGEYDIEKHGFPYRKYAGVAETGKNRDSLKALTYEESNGEFKNYNEDYYKKIGTDNSEKLFIQKANLLLESDPALGERLLKLRESLTVGDISLLDNLMSVSLKSYTDDKLRALFGFDRVKLLFQNGADNLVDAYFGVNNNAFNLNGYTKKREKKEN